MKKKIMTRQMAVSPPEDIGQKILEKTDKEGISISFWIRRAIEKYLESENQSREESQS